MLTDIRKTKYFPLNRAEHFIVHLLEDEILTFLDKNCKKRSLGHYKVLDVGCGNQPFKKLLLDRDAQYFGMDIEQNKYGNVDFILPIDQTINDPEIYKKGPYDLIIVTEVLEHVFDLKQAFQNLNSLLSDTGEIIITCPFFYGLHEEPYDFWRMTNHALERFSLENG